MGDTARLKNDLNAFGVLMSDGLLEEMTKEKKSDLKIPAGFLGGILNSIYGPLNAKGVKK